MACTLCGSAAPRPGCPRCEIVQPSLFGLPPPPPPSDEEWAQIRAAERAHLERVTRAQGRLVAFRALDRPVRVALIGAPRHMRDEPGPASLVYNGNLFRRSVAYAAVAADIAFVLSPLHGPLALDEDVKPYRFTMKERGKDSRAFWAEQVVHELERQLPKLHLLLIGLASQEFLDPLWRALLRKTWQLERPLLYKNNSQRIGWLKRETDRLAGKRPRPRRRVLA